jgi:hypothetical protein
LGYGPVLEGAAGSAEMVGEVHGRFFNKRTVSGVLSSRYFTEQIHRSFGPEGPQDDR